VVETDAAVVRVSSGNGIRVDKREVDESDAVGRRSESIYTVNN